MKNLPIYIDDVTLGEDFSLEIYRFVCRETKIGKDYHSINIISSKNTQTDYILITQNESEVSESEEKEIDEQKKIFEYAFNSKSTAINTVKNHYKYSLEKYNSRYLEYTTPPPEGVSSLYV